MRRPEVLPELLVVDVREKQQHHGPQAAEFADRKRVLYVLSELDAKYVHNREHQHHTHTRELFTCRRQRQELTEVNAECRCQCSDTSRFNRSEEHTSELQSHS